MAGLIKEQMDAATPMEGANENEGANEDAAENNPAFKQAMRFAMHVLYEQGAADDVAKQLRAGQDKVESLANIAYEITNVVDEKTEGQVPDELIALLGMAILNEIIDIAEAAKMGITPADAAAAFKQMLLRYLGENGVDTTQLQQSMDQVDPKVFEGA
jgi:hypothetical protein